MNSKQLSVSRLLYVGSYGETDEATIHVCSLNEETGELTLVQKVMGVEQASYLELHPKLNKLYAAKETYTTNDEFGGAVAAIDIDEHSGQLGVVTSQALTKGAHPCYISVANEGKAILAANYTSGNVALLPLTKDGELAEATSVMNHSGEPGPVTDRQEAAHAHCIIPMPGTAYICAVDLGIDAIVTYTFSEQANTINEHSICKLPAGAGPRHLVFHPRLPYAYVANELASTVSKLRMDKENGQLIVESTIASIPAEHKAYNDSADIHISEDGRFLYSSNRGHNSIAVYAIDQEDGSLQAIQFMSCGGEQPRNFALSPSGQFLLAANQKSGTIVVFNVSQQSGMLKPAGYTLEVSKPVCIRFSLKH